MLNHVDTVLNKSDQILPMHPADEAALPGLPPESARLYAEAYEDLRRIARSQLARHPRTQSLETTALVHESYLRFAEAHRDIADKRHFLGYAARVMRSVIVDYARMRNAARRGGQIEHTTLNSEILDNITLETDVLHIDEALNALEGADPQLARIVELRFFAGLSVEAAAEVIGLSERTLFREWEKARLILMEAIRDGV
ncbi:MAG: ECF-type sigma factor [Burkholderiales bacterium]|nr:ECF-type sigma factor [Burkholderiales bacterium]